MKQLLKISNHTLLLLLLFVISSGFAVSRDLKATKVTLNMQNATLIQIFDKIKTETAFNFTYGELIAKDNHKYDAVYDNIFLNNILLDLGKRAQLDFKVIDTEIMVTQKTKKLGPIKSVIQQIAITGIVTDNNGLPLFGASITEKGTTNGTTTDFDGGFNISVTNSNSVLVVSYIGFITKEFTVGEKNNIQVVLQGDEAKLDEILLIGYGTQKKINLTGAVSSIKSKDIENRPITQASNALQGLVPGVFVNSNSGEAGNDVADIRIRGIGTLNDSNPLILVDGIEAPLNSVNPNDIKNINVLKDAASASIYGTRGANGVILVTTKRGKFDSPTEIKYDTYYGFASPTILPDMVWDNKTYMELYREAAINSNRNFNFDDEDIARYDALSSTNWMEELVKDSAPITNHNISLSGGSEKISYYFSNGYLDQQGWMEGSNEFKRFSSKLNLDAKLNEKLKFGTSVSAFKRDGFLTPKDNSSNPRGFGQKGSLVFSGAMVQHPIAPVFDQFGRYGSFEADLGIERNRPNGQAEADQIDVELNGFDFLGSTFIEYNPIDELFIKATFGINYQEDLFKDTRKEYSTYDPVTGNPFTNANGTRHVGNLLNQRFLKSLNVTTLIQANYGFDVKKNRFDFLGGFSREKASIENSIINELGFGTQDVITIGQGTVVQNSGSFGEWGLVSFFGRTNYNYDERYLIEANLRYDASSRFGKNNRWAAFPSFSAGWIVSNESFWNENVINFLKIKASWGKLGNQSTNFYPFVSQISLGQNYNANPGGALTRLGNDDLKWEETTSINIGLDMMFFKNKIGLEVDYFTKNTDDIITDLNNPLISGVSSPTTVNAASIENKGFEFLINYRDNFGEFKVNIGLNATNVKNEVTSLNPNLSDDQDRIRIGGASNNIWLIRGEPIFSMFGHQMAGIFQSQEEIDNAPDHSFIGTPQPGDFRYTDTNNDGVIDADDQVPLGSRQPEWLYGANFSFGYKGFELSGLVQGIGKTETWIARMYGPFPFAGIRTFWEENRWTPDNPSQNHPRLWVDRTGYNGQSINNADKQISYWVQDRAYIRLRNIQLGYTFSNELLKNSFFKNLRIYLNGENLWTSTKLDDLDPERFDRESHATSPLPQNKTITFGLNATF